MNPPGVLLPYECQTAAHVCSGHFLQIVCPIKLWLMSMPTNSHAPGYNISYHVLRPRLMGGNGIAREDV